MSSNTKQLTVSEAGKLGGKARAARYSHQQLSRWGSLGGWKKGKPRKAQPKTSQ